MKAHNWLAAAALLAATASGAVAQKTFQFEDLEPKRCTEGTTGEVNVVESGLSTPGKIGGDRATHWFGMETEGAVIEYEIPVGSPGRYRLTLGLVKSWDYGVYKVLVDGKPVGGHVDLASKAGEEKVLPCKVDLGIHELSREHILLSIEYVGASPNAIDGPNPRSCGLDYVMLTPAPAGATGGQTTTTGGATTSVGKASTVQLESLEWSKCSEGTTGDVDMIGAGFARGGEFGADHIVHWFGMEHPGATLEYRVPLAVSGRYRVTLGVARSWDYGLYEFAINGKPAGGRAYLASKAEPEKVFPLKVDLGVHDLQREHILLAIKFAGASPNAIDGPNPKSGGFDYITFTPVPVTQTGGTTTTTGAGLSFEAEKLTVARCTVGTAEKVNLVDGNLAKSGQFGGDTIVHWAGMEEPGAVLELRVPIATPGRYSVTVGIARSWDYGVYQFLLDGQEKGSRVDFASKAGEEKVLPAKIDLGTVSAKKPALVLGIRFIGESPNAIPGPNPMSMGIDWVRLTPAPTPGGKPARPGK